jgi:hypothetical protein
MAEKKSFLHFLAEAVDLYHAQRQAAIQEPVSTGPRNWLRWMGRQMVPNIGTLLLVAVLLVTVPSLAAPRYAPEATSTSTISYQGRLADSAGSPLTGYYNLEFRIYDVPTGGVPLWEEFWTGGNSVQVSDGLFNVMLGSINNTLASAIEGHDELYLGITVGTDSEMTPRVQLGSVPFAMQALFANVPDGSITTEKIADGAVTQAKAPFALAGPGYRMETGTASLTGDEEGFGSNFLTKHITFSEPFSTACPTVVFANTSMGWVGWEARIVAMAGNISNNGFSAAVFRVDGGAISTHPHFEWMAVGCQ